MNDKVMYGVTLLRESIEINVLGLSQDVDLSWDKNMIGALPVFKDKDSALVYAKGREELVFSLSKEEEVKEKK